MPQKRPHHHSVEQSRVTYRLRRLYPDYYTSDLQAALVARDHCTVAELVAAQTEEQQLALSRLAHEREIKQRERNRRTQ